MQRSALQLRLLQPMGIRWNKEALDTACVSVAGKDPAVMGTCCPVMVNCPRRRSGFLTVPDRGLFFFFPRFLVGGGSAFCGQPAPEGGSADSQFFGQTCISVAEDFLCDGHSGLEFFPVGFLLL